MRIYYNRKLFFSGSKTSALLSVFLAMMVFCDMVSCWSLCLGVYVVALSVYVVALKWCLISLCKMI